MTLEGANFVLGVQIVVGPQILNDVSARSTSVLTATVRAGITPGPYDVQAINPDGTKATLHNGFTVTAASSLPDGGSGTRGAPSKGCGCGSGLGLDSSWVLASLLALSRRSSQRRGRTLS